VAAGKVEDCLVVAITLSLLSVVVVRNRAYLRLAPAATCCGRV
jgi:hypothetical protein